MNPNSRNPFIRFAAEHSLLEWLGIGLTILPFALSALGGPRSMAQWIAAFAAGVISTLIAVSVFRIGARRDAVAADSLLHHFDLSGPRGEKCVSKVTLLIKSQTEHLPSFLAAKQHASGEVRAKVFKYRNHRKNQPSDTLEFLHLDREHIDAVKDLSGETFIYVRPPDTVRRGELLEIVTEESVANCFSSDAEFVEKEVIFPIARLRFELQFSGTQPIVRVAGSTTALGTAERTVPLAPVTDGAATRVTWEVSDARPGDRYRLTWGWDGSAPSGGA